MAESALAAPQTSSRVPARLGSFELGPRVVDASKRAGACVVVAVTGAQGTVHAESRGFASCVALPEGNQALIQQVSDLLPRIERMSGPTLIPVLETGIAGRVAYVVQSTVEGDRLSDLLARERRLPAWTVNRVVADVAGALAIAHDARVSHGAITPFSVWADRQGRFRLGGFGVSGRGPAHDIEMLASLAFELLAGQPPAPLSGSTGYALVERLRGQTTGMTERVAAVIAQGLESEPSNRTATVREFATRFSDSIHLSTADIVAGAWEAVSRDDLPMAKLLVDMVAAYDPEQQELALLRLRLEGGTMSDPALAAASLLEAATYPGPGKAPLTETATRLPANPSTGGETPAFTTMSATSSSAGPGIPSAAKPRANSWVLFVAGISGMVIILVVLSALTFTRT